MDTISTPPAEHVLCHLRRPQREKHLRRLPHCALLQRGVPKGPLEGAPARLQGGCFRRSVGAAPRASRRVLGEAHSKTQKSLRNYTALSTL